MILSMLLYSIFFAVSVGEGAGGGPAAIERIIESLVADLGSEEYARREAATEMLRRIGPSAQGALEKAEKSDDPEVRLRARKILTDLRLGITPDWPADLALLARHYDAMTSNERRNAMRRIAEGLKEKAVIFLVSKMADSDSNQAQYAMNYLMGIHSTAACRKVIELVGEPANAFQTRALAYARSRLGSTPDTLAILEAGRLDTSARNDMIEAGIEQLLDQLSQKKYSQMAEAAGRFAESAAGDARFPYLQAEALAALGESKRAADLRKQAHGLNPKEEAPHYAAGQMLMKLGRRVLAAREWEAILAIPPDGGVYDINAHFRLGTIYDACGLFDKAADSLDRGLAGYEKAKAAGHGMGIIGSTPESIRSQIAALRRKAARYPADPGDVIEDEIAEDEILVSIDIRVKDGKDKELRGELAKVAGTLNMRVMPPGLRIFDVAPAALKYDPEKKQIAVMLNDVRCSDTVPFEVKGAVARIAVNTLDCCYIFEIEAATGKATKLARFEKDYVIKFVPGAGLAALAHVAAKINGENYSWSKLLEGVEFDHLPEIMKVSVEGTTPNGKRITVRVEIEVREPEIGPAEEPAAE